MLQREPHVPALHVGVAFGRGGHEVVQLPQWVTAADTSVSQPLLVRPSQSPKPVSQTDPQSDIAHVDIACAGAEQTCAQVPQFAGSRVTSVHDAPQSVCVGSATPPHVLTHDATPVIASRWHANSAAHAAPHAPQLLEVVRSRSQPSSGSALQSPKPAWHSRPQPVAPQIGLACAGAAGHAVAQEPQCEASTATCTSQPSSTRPSQSAHPASHEPIAHEPSPQTPVACAGVHGAPQDPQFVIVTSAASQPSSARALQSP